MADRPHPTWANPNVKEAWRKWLIGLYVLAVLILMVALAAYGAVIKHDRNQPPTAKQPSTLTEAIQGFKVEGVHKGEPDISALPQCAKDDPDGTQQEVCVTTTKDNIAINWNFGTRFVLIPRN